MDITIYLEDEQAQKLPYIQQRTSQDAAVLMRQAIDRQYEQLVAERQTPLEIFEDLGLVGCMEGEPDLSTNYKAVVSDYLDEKHQQGRL